MHGVAVLTNLRATVVRPLDVHQRLDRKEFNKDNEIPMLIGFATLLHNELISRGRFNSIIFSSWEFLWCSAQPRRQELPRRPELGIIRVAWLRLLHQVNLDCETCALREKAPLGLPWDCLPRLDSGVRKWVGTYYGSTAMAEQAQERINFEAGLELQRQLNEREKVPAEATQSQTIDWSDPAVLRYHALQNRPYYVAEVKKNMVMIKHILLYLWIQRIRKKGTEKKYGGTRKKTLASKRADDEESVNPEILSTKYPIVDWEYQLLGQINMLVEKKYPLIKDLLEKMLNLQLEAEKESTMAYELPKFIKSQIEEQ
ncbi:hypothetical protein Tco_0266730 [Tanacetum coccineum]